MRLGILIKSRIVMLRVGLLLSPSKYKKLKLLAAVESSTRSDILTFYLLDPLKSLEEQGLTDLDLILHRLHDYLICFTEIDCQKYVELLKMEVEINNIKLLCPIEKVDLLADRVGVMKALEPISGTNCGEHMIFVPETFDVTEELIYAGVIGQKLKEFPLMLKSTGCSFITSERYRMKILFELSDDDRRNLLDDLAKTRLAAQRFIDHDGRLYKMFIIGEKWHVVGRKSIKNLSHRNDKSTIIFLSNSISKSDSVSPLHDIDHKDRPYPTLDERSCEALYNKVMSCFQCELMGVDFVIQSGTKNLYIVDVNYFPGYDGFSEKHHLGDAFIDLFLKTVSDQP